MAPIKLCDRETQAQIRFEADTFRLVKVGWFTALGTVLKHTPSLVPVQIPVWYWSSTLPVVVLFEN